MTVLIEHGETTRGLRGLLGPEVNPSLIISWPYTLIRIQSLT